MSNPQRDPLTKIILMAYTRGKAILKEREKTARQVQTEGEKSPGKVEPNTNR